VTRLQRQRPAVRSLSLASIEDFYLKSYGTTGRIDVAQRRSRIRSIERVNEHSDTLGLRHKLVQQCQPFCRKLRIEEVARRMGLAGRPQ
jgi:hypothetical protein